jgi:hypothetical protein
VRLDSDNVDAVGVAACGELALDVVHQLNVHVWVKLSVHKIGCVGAVSEEHNMASAEGILPVQVVEDVKAHADCLMFCDVVGSVAPRAAVLCPALRVVDGILNRHF